MEKLQDPQGLVAYELFDPEPVEPAPSYARIDLTMQQKRWLKERDPICQFPYHHICTGLVNLQLHHAIPQMYAQLVRKEDMYQINEARRIIRLCKPIHIGDLSLPLDPNTIHPEQRQAALDYQVDKHAFQDVGERHRTQALLGLKYWMPENDEELLDIAAFRTRLYERKYQHPYPVGGVVNGRVVRK